MKHGMPPYEYGGYDIIFRNNFLKNFVIHLIKKKITFVKLDPSLREGSEPMRSILTTHDVHLFLLRSHLKENLRANENICVVLMKNHL